MMNNQFENQAKQFNLAINQFDGALRLIDSSHIQSALGPYYGEGIEDTVLRSLFSNRYQMNDYSVIYHECHPLDAHLEISAITSLYINKTISVGDRSRLIAERLQRFFVDSDLLTWGYHCYSPDPLIIYDVHEDIASFAAQADPVAKLTLYYYAGVLLLSLIDKSSSTRNLVLSLSSCFTEEYHDVARFYRNWAAREVEKC